MSGFTDQALFANLRGHPSSLEKTYKPLLKQLDALGVKLLPDGSVDYS